MSLRFLLLIFCLQALALPMPRALALRAPAPVAGESGQAVVETAPDLEECVADGGSAERADEPADAQDDRPPPPSGEEDDLIHGGYDPLLHPTQPPALPDESLPPAPPHLERPPRPPAS